MARVGKQGQRTSRDAVDHLDDDKGNVQRNAEGEGAVVGWHLVGVVVGH